MTEIARGLAGVIITETRLSRVDGEAGQLVIAGFPLEELAPKASFEEVLYLLWNDRLPNVKELEALRSQMASFRSIPEATVTILQAGLELTR